MNVRASEFSQFNIACDNQILASCRPAFEAEIGAPIPLVHDAVGDDGIILAMIHYRQIKHAGIF